jgi:serine/threonine protein phosphatase 1
MRRFAIGDIHGCAKALRGLLDVIDPQPTDEIVFLGDYVDRGPDSRDCIEQIIQLSHRSRVVALRGNHELMLCGVAFAGMDAKVWYDNGGHATVASYGGRIDKIPSHHRDFLVSLRMHYETETDIFVHACYEPDVEMTLQKDEVRYWQHLRHPWPRPHQSGKRVYVGHTPQADGHVLDLGYMVCLDTACFAGGLLTAMNLDDMSIIQVDKHGHLRQSPWNRMKASFAELKKMMMRRLSNENPS